MYAGRPHLCLKSRNLDASRRFYEALGLAFVEDLPGKRITLERGSFTITLMTFLDEDLLNFRGADAFAIHGHLGSKGISAPGEPERYRKEKEVLKRAITEPFKRYRDDLALNWVIPNALPFETEKNVFSRILKNIFQR